MLRLLTAVLLLLTGLAKILSAFGHDFVLQVGDPVLGVSYRVLFLCVGSIEIAVGSFCLFSGREGIKAGLVAWLATTFLLYRLAHIQLGNVEPCKCLGSLTGALGISPDAADQLMKYVLGYLLVWSYGTFIMKMKRGGITDEPPNSLPANQ